MKTFVAILCIGLTPVGLTTPGHADSNVFAAMLPTDPLRLFATCAGRISALREHEWLMGHAESSTAALYATLEDLYNATVVEEGDGRAMALRIEAKAQMRNILSRAAFGSGLPALQAHDLSDAMVDACRAVVLPSLKA